MLTLCHNIIQKDLDHTDILRDITLNHYFDIMLIREAQSNYYVGGLGKKYVFLTKKEAGDKPYEDSGTDYSLKFLGTQRVRAMPHIPFKIKHRCFACCILYKEKKPWNQVGLFRFWRQHSTARKSCLLIYQVT